MHLHIAETKKQMEITIQEMKMVVTLKHYFWGFYKYMQRNHQFYNQ